MNYKKEFTLGRRFEYLTDIYEVIHYELDILRGNEFHFIMTKRVLKNGNLSVKSYPFTSSYHSENAYKFIN